MASDLVQRPVLERSTREQLIVLDVVAALGLGFVLTTFGLAQVRPAWAGLVLAVGSVLPLPFRRRHPVAVFGVVAVMSALTATLQLDGFSFVPLALAAYTVALERPRPAWEPTLAIGIGCGGCLLGAVLVGPPSWAAAGLGSGVLGSALVGAAWMLGRVVRERRASAARLAEELAHRAVSDERLRIARELHDVVAHHLGLIAVKSGVAAHVAKEQPHEAHDALHIIEGVSRGALSEMRRMLGVLRAEPQARADRAPAARLADLHDVVERAALAGVRTDLELRGAADLPEIVESSVFRIVQEAVTNVVRHAAPAHCTVTIEASADEVRVEVCDDGPGHHLSADRSEGPGHGLIGMRERVLMYGGGFEAGPRAGGGFAVAARLPIGGPS